MFYSSVIAEIRKHEDFTLQGGCQSGWKAVLGKQLSVSQHQNSGMDLCVPQGAALGLRQFDTSTNDLDDKTQSVLIKHLRMIPIEEEQHILWRTDLELKMS